MAEYTVKQGNTGPTINVASKEMTDLDGWVCRLRILNYDGTAAIDKEVLTANIAGDQFVAFLTPAETSSLSVETYRLVIELSNANKVPVFNIEQSHILNIDQEFEIGAQSQLVQLEVGVNSFMTYESSLATIGQNAFLDFLVCAERSELKSAMVQAYHNIGLMKTDFGYYVEDGLITSTSDYSPADLALLSAKHLEVLYRAQIVEANALVGGEPIEDRRKAGLISDSSGESAQFFRSAKPIDMPISKATANVLRGHIIWSLGVSR